MGGVPCLVAAEATGVGEGDGNGVAITKAGMAAAIGCAACVVVFKAGAKAVSLMALGLIGQMPHFLKACCIVIVENAFLRALE